MNSKNSIFSIMGQMAKENNAINLGQGYPNFDCHKELKELVSYYLQKGYNQYCPMPGLLTLRNAIEKKLKITQNLSYDASSEITITAGATQAIFTAIISFVKPHDEVIIIEPAYDSYRPTLELARANVISYRLKSPNFNINWKDFAKLISDKTSLVIVNTPHNPTGKIMTKEDWTILANLIKNKDIRLLSDEVYEHLVYDDKKHVSALSIPNLRSKTIAVYSFGKTFHATGWKIGYAISNKTMTQAFRHVHQWNVFCVNSFIQHALAKYLEKEEKYLNLSRFYQEKRDHFQKGLKHSNFKIMKTEGSYFQIVDYSKISNRNDIAFSELLCKKYGIASIPVSPFCKYKSEDRLIRFCFAKKEETLSKATEKLCKIPLM